MTTTLRDAIYRVIDCETTGLDPSSCGVCEVAYRDIQGSGEASGQMVSMLLNPGHPIPPASAIHHIVDDDVAGMPHLDGVRASLEAPLYVAHNADFDAAFLGLDRARFICTHRLAKHMWPELDGHGNQQIRYALKLQPELPKDAPSHRAANDVATTAAILVAALRKLPEVWPDIETVESLIERIKQPVLLRVVPFRSAGGVTFERADIGLLRWIVDRGAGGDDCVHSALHWLDKRGYADDDDGFYA
jgi:exodeoxyribonuclease X